MSLRNRIHSYLIKWYEHDPMKFVHKGEILRLATDAGYENENAGRRLRELENDGKVEVNYIKGQNGAKQAMYRARPTWAI